MRGISVFLPNLSGYRLRGQEESLSFLHFSPKHSLLETIFLSKSFSHSRKTIVEFHQESHFWRIQGVKIVPRGLLLLLGISFGIKVWILMRFRGVNPRVLLSYENGFGLMNLGLFNSFCLRFLMRIVFIYVVCCYSGESGSNSGFRMDFWGF